MPWQHNRPRIYVSLAETYPYSVTDFLCLTFENKTGMNSKPTIPALSTVAPSSNKISTISLWPLRAAQMRGVVPYWMRKNKYKYFITISFDNKYKDFITIIS